MTNILSTHEIAKKKIKKNNVGKRTNSLLKKTSKLGMNLRFKTIRERKTRLKENVLFRNFNVKCFSENLTPK